MATHVRAERGRRTNPDHYPPEKIAFHLRTPTWCRTTAAGIGPACETVIAALLVDNALFRIRAAQGILGLRAKHDAPALENACATALAAGDPSYRTIKGILALHPSNNSNSSSSGGGGGGGRGNDRGRAEGVPAFLRGQDELFSTSEPATRPAAPIVTAATNVVHLPTTSTRETTSEPTGELATATNEVAR